mgnify:CR=1 FL=1
MSRGSSSWRLGIDCLWEVKSSLVVWISIPYGEVEWFSCLMDIYPLRGSGCFSCLMDIYPLRGSGMVLLSYGYLSPAGKWNGSPVLWMLIPYGEVECFSCLMDVDPLRGSGIFSLDKRRNVVPLARIKPNFLKNRIYGQYVHTTVYPLCVCSLESPVDDKS